MKFIFTIFLLLAYNCAVFADTIEGLVVSVADGDTITILDDTNTQHKIRLAGIDAPEKKQAFGNVSKRALSDLVYKKQVNVEFTKRDRYQRIIGKVLADDQDVNLEMLKVGLAWHYVKYQKEQTFEDRIEYAQAEKDSRLLRRGLWLDEAQTAPWDFRKSKK